MSQYQPRFTLKSSHSEKKEIVLRIYYKYNTFSLDIKDGIGRVLRIHPELWDKTKQYPVSKSKIPTKFRHETYNLQTIGATIDKLKVYVNEIINEAASASKLVDNKLLKNELNLKMGFTTKAGEITLYDFCLETIKEMEDGVLLIDSTHRYTQSTIDKYIYTARILEVFKPKTTFNQVDKDWYNSFLLFLTNKQSVSYKDKDGNEKEFIKKDLQPGSIGNYIKNLKFLMSYAIEKQISNNRIHNEKWFRRPKSTTISGKTELALTESEIKKLYELEIHKKGLIIARDLFLVGCYTGLRVSDFNSKTTSLTFSEAINEKNETVHIIIKTIKKTKSTVYIPFLWDELKEIFQKHNYNIPRIADQTINDYIKEICKNIKSMKEEIQWNKTIGGNNVTVTSAKWELVSNHSARRSFVSNLTKRGFNDKEIGYMTGHRSKEMITLYDKLTGNEKAIMIYNKFKNQK